MSRICRTRVILVSGLTIAAFAMLSLSCWLGSFSATVRLLNGERMVFARTMVNLGEVTTGKEVAISLVVTNVRMKPSLIEGAVSPCSCLTTSGLPKLVKPFGHEELNVLLTTPTTVGPMTLTLTFYADDGLHDVEIVADVVHK